MCGGLMVKRMDGSGKYVCVNCGQEYYFPDDFGG